MGVDYTVVVYDDFDWNYLNQDKEWHKLKLLEELGNLCPELEFKAEWYRHMVFDLGRKWPEDREIKEILLKQDAAHYYSCQDPKMKLLQRE